MSSNDQGNVRSQPISAQKVVAAVERVRAETHACSYSQVAKALGITLGRAQNHVDRLVKRGALGQTPDVAGSIHVKNKRIAQRIDVDAANP